jgi:DNA processing protein
VTTERFISRYDSAKQAYHDSSENRRNSGAFTKTQLELMDKIPLSRAEDIIENCNKNRWKILTPDMEQYPKRLLELPNFPLALYYVGNFPDVDREPLIAMVGARDATTYGLRMASALAGDLAKAGMIVVSGGALGIDSQCHRSTIEAGGRTVAVLGNGFGVNYLPQNRELWNSIARNGAVVTEFKPGTEASRYTFPIRNRIISGLSLGTVVVEAGQRSGSLITARCACDQGRDVFAVPGEVINTAFYGGNKLIKDGAKPVFSAMDILEEYRGRFVGKINCAAVNDFIAPHEESTEKVGEEIKIKLPAPDTLSSAAKAVYDLIGLEEAVGVDVIIEKSGLENRKVIVCLTELEMAGIVECLAGRKYIAKA